MHTIHHVIGGREIAEADRFGDVHNPATGELRARVAFASDRDVAHAVEVAKAAFREWRDVSLGRRTQVMFRFRQLLAERAAQVAELVTAEHGKVRTDALGEVQRGLEVVEFACGIPELLKGSFSENVSSQVDSYSIRQPLGVVAGITPFNFPAMVPMWMFPLAIATGNTFILKPSEKDPSAANAIAALLKEAGLPDGVFNVVHGDRAAVDALLAHPDVKAISFVGSTPIAEHIYRTGSANRKRVQALGGAKNHMLVLPDADMELAADSAVNAAYGSAGERCMAISVVVAVGEAADGLIASVRERIRGIRVGDGSEPGVDMGPLVTKAHLDRVVKLVDRGVEEGASLVEDGRGLRVSGRENGYFLGPCLFDRVQPSMTIYREEIFGPVLSVVRARTFDDALALINRNPYANGVAVFTNDGGAARMFRNSVEVGMVGINVPIPVPVAYHSFGGWKASLFGDTHVHGREGVHFYTRGKVVTERWPDPSLRGKNLGFPTLD